MNNQKENNSQLKNYIDKNGVLVVPEGGIIPGIKNIDPKAPMILSPKTSNLLLPH